MKSSIYLIRDLQFTAIQFTAENKSAILQLLREGGLPYAISPMGTMIFFKNKKVREGERMKHCIQQPEYLIKLASGEYFPMPVTTFNRLVEFKTLKVETKT